MVITLACDFGFLSFHKDVGVRGASIVDLLGVGQVAQVGENNLAPSLTVCSLCLCGKLRAMAVIIGLRSPLIHPMFQKKGEGGAES